MRPSGVPDRINTPKSPSASYDSLPLTTPRQALIRKTAPGAPGATRVEHVDEDRGRQAGELGLRRLRGRRCSDLKYSPSSSTSPYILRYKGV